MTTTPLSPIGRSGISPMLNSIGALVVAFWLVFGRPFAGLSIVVVAVSLVALLAWVLLGFSKKNTARGSLAVVMMVGGALMTRPTDGLLITPAIVAVAAIAAEPRWSLKIAVAFAAVGAAIVTVASIATHMTSSYLLGVLGGFALGLVVGFSRRQNRAAALRERELFERSVEVEREQQRSALLADRAAVARDIHDVLAHSLGGLVIQLDAASALLENGRVDEATIRVDSARTLAADGLDEARRAVSALRDPSDTGLASDVGADAVEQLVAAHESLGGRAVRVGSLDLASLDQPSRRAVAGIAREALNNARRHAPGEIVTVACVVGDPSRILRFSVSNPLPSRATVSPGGGHGLEGMRERIAGLPGATLDVGVDGGAFVVDMAVSLPEVSA